MVYGKRMDHLSDVFKDEGHQNDWLFLSRDESDDEAILRRVVRDAREMQLKYRACGQTCLYPLALHLGLGTRETVVAMTTLTGGFGGGEICCALVGAIAAIGLEFGRVDFTEMGGPAPRGTALLPWPKHTQRNSGGGLWNAPTASSAAVICRSSTLARA